jgi:hypothetical protein
MQVFGKCGKSSPPRFCAARSHSNALRSLEARFDAAGDGPVTGVPRREFAALIEAMLGALIEADLFHARNAADAARLYAKAKEARVAMGIGERGIPLSLSSGQKRPLLGEAAFFRSAQSGAPGDRLIARSLIRMISSYPTRCFFGRWPAPCACSPGRPGIPSRR